MNILVEDICEDIDEMDTLLKTFALYISRFTSRYDADYMNIITYNVCDTLITKEFDHVGHKLNINQTKTIDFTKKFVKAAEFITNKIL